jgi:hypothetical protein
MNIRLSAALAAVMVGGAMCAPVFAAVPIVGGAPMSPSKDIVDNAVNSKGHMLLPS